MKPRPNEQWKPFPDWEGYYEVSDLGRVRSIQRQRAKGIYLQPVRRSSGYLIVNLTGGGKRKQVLIHKAVLRAFVGEPQPGQQSCHSNRNRTDNKLTNLRWGTAKENHMDKERHGTYGRGEGHPNNRYPSELMEGLRNKTISIKDAVKRYGINRSYASLVASGKARWRLAPA